MFPHGGVAIAGITTIGGASKFGGNMQMTSANPEFEFNSQKGIPELSKQSIFVTDSTGELNYCKRTSCVVWQFCIPKFLAF